MSDQNHNVNHKPESISDKEKRSSTIRRELEEILSELGSDEKSAAIKIKVENALTALLKKEEKSNPIKTLDSFSKNLEKILREWDSLLDGESREKK